MKKLSITYNHDQLLYLKWMLETTLLKYAAGGNENREQAMILSVLMCLHKRISGKVFEGQSKNRIVFKYFEAQAIVIAYENGWLEAKETDDFAKNTLRITYNNLHQKTV